MTTESRSFLKIVVRPKFLEKAKILYDYGNKKLLRNRSQAEVFGGGQNFI